MDLGATLRHARETRGATHEDLSRATRIPMRILLAMERDDWAKVPGGIFARGYLRAYARQVGIDAAPLVAHYEAEYGPKPEPSPAEVTAAGTGERPPTPWPRWSVPEGLRRLVGWPALAAAMLLGSYLVAGRAPIAAPPAIAPAAPALAGPALAEPAGPVGTSGSARDPSPAPAATATPRGDGVFAVELAVTRPCWVRLVVDDVRRINRIVQPGERERLEGRDFAIRVGDAGALQLSLDGRAARAVGANGEVRTVRITEANYQSMLTATTGKS
jgi:cytoskeleton protein RodZ